MRGSRKAAQRASGFHNYAATAVCVCLSLAVALVFGQTVRHEFLHYDDREYVSNNPAVAGGLTVQGVRWAFTSVHRSNWHPLTWLSHMLDCQLFALSHPGGHHLTNVLLHTASAIGLLLVLRQMTGKLWPSAMVATLFAVHPLHVESVAWVAERKDVLSGLFFVLTLAAYAGYARRRFSLSRYLLVTALFVFGLMAKPMLVTVPFVLLLLDYWPLERGEESRASKAASGVQGAESSEAKAIRRSAPSARRPPPAAPRRLPVAHGPAPFFFRQPILEKLPWLILAAGSCVVTYIAQEKSGAVSQGLPLSGRVANALVSYVAYLGQFFYPADLAAAHPLQDTLPSWKIIASLLLLAGISAVAVVFRSTRPHLLVGWLWYLGMHVPVIGLVQVGVQATADRYTYLPQIGLCIALAWEAEYVSRLWPDRRWVAVAASAFVGTGLVWSAWRQASYWKDDEALWRHTLACTSKNWFAEIGLGIALSGHGRLKEAVKLFKEAVKLKPDYAEGRYNLGLALAMSGQDGSAIAEFEEALKIKHDYAEAHNGLGVAFSRRNLLDKAVDHFQIALSLQPDNPERHFNLGLALASRGQFEEAVPHYQWALKENPNYVEAHYNLGLALAERGQMVDANAHYHKAIDLARQQGKLALAEFMETKTGRRGPQR